MLSRIMFGKVVSIVIGAFILEYIELLLCMLLTKPMIPHIPGFRTLLVYIFMNKAVCGEVICFERYWWLCMIEFL